MDLTKKIRLVLQSDVEKLKEVVDSCGLFPSEYLEEMISDFFNNPITSDIWFTCICDSKPVAFGYCVPEKLTNGTFNLLAIGVSAEMQRRGLASEMMQFIEQYLKEKKARILIVETSSNEAQLGARNLYLKLEYSHIATIQDFWDVGDDKLIFLKKFSSPIL